MTQTPSTAAGAAATADTITSIFADVDSMDANRFARNLTDDISFRYANAPAVEGRPAVEAAVAQFFTTIKGLSHEIRALHQDGDTAIAECRVTYTRHDGVVVTVDGAIVFEMRDGQAAGYRIYIDLTPVYA